MTCHPERKGPQTFFSFRGPRRQVFVCGVEFGGGESKDLRLHFGIYATNFKDRALVAKSCFSVRPATRIRPPPEALIHRLTALEARLHRVPVLDCGLTHAPAKQNNLIVEPAGEIQ